MDNRLSFFLDESNEFFIVLGRDGVIVHTNAALRKVFGYTETELNGTNANYFSHPADIKRREHLLKSIAEQKQVAGYESRLKAKNGLYFATRWSFLLNEDDDLIYATGINLTNRLNASDQKTIDTNLQHIIQSFNEGFVVMDSARKIIAFNPAFQAITGLTSEELKNINFKQITGLGITGELMLTLEQTFNSNTFSEIQYLNTYFNRWLRLNIYPYKNDITIFIRDITNIKRQQLILALEKGVLEQSASATYSLPQTIDEFLKGIESIFPEMVCSVLEVDDAQERLYHLSAPSLPAAYINFIDGAAIGPKTGSCGAAVYHRSQIIVSDIETDPFWADYKHLILPYGFKACWSTPIISSHSAKVLAAFAVYYTSPREPKPEELQIIERTSNILRVLIENKKNQQHVKDQTNQLQEIAAISSHELRRPVATILGLVNLFDQINLNNPLNKEIITHLGVTAQELDNVIHTIVEKTIYLKSEH